jgi:hypothetical protein
VRIAAGLRADLERIRDAAAALPPPRVPDGAWLQIAGRLRQEGRVGPAASAPSSPRPSYAWMAIAASLVLVAGLSVFAVMRLRAPASPAPVTASAAASTGHTADASVEAAQTAVDAAQQQFEKAILDLEKVARANSNALDPATSTVIDKNLGIIDSAIAENRAAVRAEPTSVAARETLFEALRQKVSLLQDTIALINEMRKGNNAAAAQLVNKS